MAIVMTHRETGNIKTVPTGFSWTTFFFGLIPAAIRGDAKWAGIMALTGLFTLGLAWLVWPFIYNGLYRADLVKKGWSATEASSFEDDFDRQRGSGDSFGDDDPIARYLAKKAADERQLALAGGGSFDPDPPHPAGPTIRTFGRKQ